MQSDTQATVSSFTALVTQDNVNYIIGPIASSIAAAAIPPWRQGKPLWMMPGASTETFETEVGKEPQFFHTFPYAYHYYTSLSGALKHYLGAGKTMAIIYVDDEYGRTHIQFARKYFTDAGFKIIDEELIRANSPDMNPVLTKISRLKPDVLLGITQTTDAITLAKQAFTRRLAVPYLVGTSAIQLSEWAAAVGEAQEGWIGLSTYLPGAENWPANSRNPKLFPSTKDWEQKFETTYHQKPDYYDALCYVNAGLLLTAIEKAGVDDRLKVAAQMRSIDMQTPYGKAKFVPTASGTTQQAFADMLVFQKQNGNNVVLYPLAAATGKLEAPKK